MYFLICISYTSNTSLQIDVINKAKNMSEEEPLIIKPRKVPISLDNVDSTTPDLPSPIEPTVVNKLVGVEKLPEIPITVETVPDDPKLSECKQLSYYAKNLQIQPLNLTNDKKNKLQLDIKEPCIPNVSKELLSPRDSRTEIQTPEDTDLLGLSSINYDIDFSDLSTEDSTNDEMTPEKRKSPMFTPDPFSPIGKPGMSIGIQSPLLPLRSVEAPFVIPFIESESEKVCNDVITPANSTLKPQSAQYSGFSKQGYQIPSIPCNTGDFSSLDVLPSSVASVASTSKEKEGGENKTEGVSGEKAVQVLSEVLETFDKLF